MSVSSSSSELNRKESEHCASTSTSMMRQWMNKLGVPFALAMMTIYAVNQYLNEQARRQLALQTPELMERVVASEPLSAGTVIGMKHLAVRGFHPSQVADESFEANEVEVLLGLQVSEDVMTGMPLTRKLLRKPVPNEFLGRLPSDRRAVSLSVNRQNAVQSQLQANDLIDLYVTFEHKGQRITSLLLSRVRILQIVRQEHENSVAEFETVTLDVSQSQAAKLVSAQQGGVLTAVQVPKVDFEERPDNLDHTDATTQTSQVTNHLAGYAGVDTSFEQLQLPEVIYGDLGVAAGQETR